MFVCNRNSNECQCIDELQKYLTMQLIDDIDNSEIV